MDRFIVKGLKLQSRQPNNLKTNLDKFIGGYDSTGTSHRCI